jgi:endogenous inhibitor of DNA gyrase (YacG/DUF329 family)
MTVRKCVRCRQPYGEAVDGVTNAARSYAPFCSKRCADVDLVHWLQGDYAIGGSGELTVNEEDAAQTPPARLADDGE